MSSHETKEVLVIYEEIPEKANLYVIPKDHEIMSAVLKMSNKFVNGDELTDEQQEAFDRWLEFQQGPEGQEHKVEPSLKRDLIGLVRFGFLL